MLFFPSFFLTEMSSHSNNRTVEDSVLLYRLHTNEVQLRTLAVILSLTGGLALSFAVGVGILIYWYAKRGNQEKPPSPPPSLSLPAPLPMCLSRLTPEPSAPPATIDTFPPPPPYDRQKN
ncbi:uncharacterized protein RHIMIDRAFT_116057 [Rhizopus microsporus ATCC 52813]|uniref:Uncharacterized protein n=1 Tax=Rhizopus microsporus ATCC 52813 TaxID=1340429 RepID=A0A2G4T0P4_RHIZD|nr:uncharacterized protein RHIMIDRAFT_116057 [Rhizopus microsporus ATCC 52813]PHZ14246.1 hypothetical protein RHIMIDRAFT_116057 [Rhizopus microsporus ATCC 52813]